MSATTPMVQAKAIPTGSPVMDATRVPTPPHVGPLDGSHWWSARSLRGTTGPVTALPDQIGQTPLALSGSGTWTFTDDATAPKMTSTGGSWLTATGATDDRTADRTIIFVGSLHPSGRQQIQIPGYTPIGVASASSLYVAGTTISGVPLPATGLYVLTLRFSSAASTVSASINGAAPTSGALPALGASLTYRLGAQTASSNADTYCLLKTWRRALTDAELAAATNDAKALFGIA